MNSVTRAFLDAALLQNPVFMTFVGALAGAVLPHSTKRSFRPALRFAVVLFFTALVGAIAAGSASATSGLGSTAVPFVYFALACAAVAVLWRSGELRDEWLGMPTPMLVWTLLIGAQILSTQQPDVAHMLGAAGGMALGFAGAFILIGGVRESSRLSESNAVFKTNPVVLISMGVFALVCAGFLFW